MTFTAFLAALRIFAAIWIGSFAVVIAAQVVTGSINTRRLLDAKRPDGRRELSTARLQLLLGTIVFAGWFAGQVYTGHRLPEVSNEWLVALAGSHATYLVGKIRTVILGQ